MITIMISWVISCTEVYRVDIIGFVLGGLDLVKVWI